LPDFELCALEPNLNHYHRSGSAGGRRLVIRNLSGLRILHRILKKYDIFVTFLQESNIIYINMIQMRIGWNACQ
jgi:hypothetical protein